MCYLWLVFVLEIASLLVLFVSFDVEKLGGGGGGLVGAFGLSRQLWFFFHHEF